MSGLKPKTLTSHQRSDSINVFIIYYSCWLCMFLSWGTSWAVTAICCPFWNERNSESPGVCIHSSQILMTWQHLHCHDSGTKSIWTSASLILSCLSHFCLPHRSMSPMFETVPAKTFHQHTCLCTPHHQWSVPSWSLRLLCGGAEGIKQTALCHVSPCLIAWWDFYFYQECNGG